MLLELSNTKVELRFWLKTHKANKAGLAPVSLRVTIAGERAEVSTNIRVKPAHWGGHHEKLTSGTDAAAKLNAALDSLAGRAHLVLQMLDLRSHEEPVTSEAVARVLRPRRATPKLVLPTVSELLDKTLHTTYAEGNEGTFRSYRSCLKVWTTWPGSAGLTLEQLTSATTAAFSIWLKARQAPTSCATVLSGLNSLLNHAAPGHLARFSGLARGCKAQRKQRKVLSPELLQQVIDAVDLPPSEQLARVVFLTQYYLHGSRVSAVLELRRDQVDLKAGRVRFITHKTRHHKNVALQQVLRRELLPYLVDAVSPMLFPYLPANYFELSKQERFTLRDAAKNRVTVGLHRLSARLNLPVRLHSHVARHTLALRAYERTGDLRVPQQMLGHASIAETAGYIASLSTEQLDRSAADVYGEN